MNKLERLVHSRVADHPHLRIPLVAAYQRLMSVVPRRNLLVDRPLRVVPGMFFGFHDKCPWSSDGSMLLVHRFDPLDPLEEIEAAPITVGILDREASSFLPLAKTRAWNWQQGAMLQWVRPHDLVLFNDHSGDQNVARLLTVSGELVAQLPYHIAAVSPTGRHALSYSFERMRHAAPEYSYRVGFHSEEDTRLPSRGGLTVVDLESGTHRLLFGLQDIANLHPLESMRDAYHYFTHGLFSPSGDRFAFFHRWRAANRVLYTRLLSCDPDGRSLHVFPVDHASHICWRDDEWLLASCRPVEGSFGYYLLRHGGDEVRHLGPSALDCDGHPQFSSDGRYVLTDTYPDRQRRQSLLVYDTRTERVETLARLRIEFKYRYARRCDFHPRWSPDCSQICFDSAHTGVRSLCVMDSPHYALREPRPRPQGGVARRQASPPVLASPT